MEKEKPKREGKIWKR